MRVAVVGCGYVFDDYLRTWASHPGLELAGVTDRDPAQVARVARHYGVPTYSTTQELLADDSVDVVLNLTSIPSHYEVTRAALEAGKHVYSEKPLVTDLEQARELVDLAESRGLLLACAPSNALSATSQTIWKVVADGLVGDVRLVYAELDDNPIYLMSPEDWRSESGAPWPYLREYEAGCTWEHVSYHLAWMCAIFGPVRSVTAFSKATLPDKTDQPLSPPDTPDFSVACLDFASGVVGRVTCSIGAPYDHRMRVIGNRGWVCSTVKRNSSRLSRRLVRTTGTPPTRRRGRSTGWIPISTAPTPRVAVRPPTIPSSACVTWKGCCAPGSVQALIPGRMRGYGSTEEVQRGVAGAGHADGVGGDR